MLPGLVIVAAKREEAIDDEPVRTSTSRTVAHCTNVLSLWMPPKSSSVAPALRAWPRSLEDSAAEQGSGWQVSETTRYLSLLARSRRSEAINAGIRASCLAVWFCTSPEESV